MFLGADVSFINEVEDSGGVYYDGAVPVDPFAFLASRGANIARARLWHAPSRTAYSTLDDVKRAFRRARNRTYRTGPPPTRVGPSTDTSRGRGSLAEPIIVAAPPDHTPTCGTVAVEGEP